MSEAPSPNPELIAEQMRSQHLAERAAQEAQMTREQQEAAVARFVDVTDDQSWEEYQEYREALQGLDNPKPETEGAVPESAPGSMPEQHKSMSIKEMAADIKEYRKDRARATKAQPKHKADPTKVDDLLDAMAYKLADLSDDGVLNLWDRISKQAGGFTEEETSSLIDKIDAARDYKQAQKDIKLLEEQAQEEAAPAEAIEEEIESEEAQVDELNEATTGDDEVVDAEIVDEDEDEPAIDEFDLDIDLPEPDDDLDEDAEVIPFRPRPVDDAADDWDGDVLPPFDDTDIPGFIELEDDPETKLSMLEGELRAEFEAAMRDGTAREFLNSPRYQELISQADGILRDMDLWGDDRLERLQQFITNIFGEAVVFNEIVAGRTRPPKRGWFKRMFERRRSRSPEDHDGDDQDTEIEDHQPIRRRNPRAVIAETEGFTWQSAEQQNPLRGEDYILRSDDTKTYGVFDGAGGHEGGKLASETAGKAIDRYFLDLRNDEMSGKLPRRRLTPENAVDHMKTAFAEAIKAMSAEIDKQVASIENPIERLAARREKEEMATTGSVLKFFKDAYGKTHAIIGHMGDSRIMYQPADAGDVYSLTSDESAPDARGRMSVITNALSPSFSPRYDQFRMIEVNPGDRFAIVSDGITGDSPDEEPDLLEIEEAFAYANPEIAARMLLEAARKRDDQSVLVVDA